MATTTEAPTPAHGPEITVLSRVASIPLISSSLETINDALSNNTYTRSSYNHAKELSSSAYKFTEPLQVKLAPLIVKADSYANKAVDVVESRYPYPFKAQPDEVATYVRERRETTTNYVNEQVNTVNKTIDERVRNPALSVVHGIDQRFAPIVDYIEVAVGRLNNSEAGPSTADPQYQYQRALALSKTLGDNLYVYSNEQLKHLQAQSVIAQRATETANNISSVATSSLSTAQAHIHTLSESMLAELQKLQTSSASLSTSLQHSLQTSRDQLQSQIPQIQQSYADLQAAITSTVNELSTILTTKDLPIQEKVARVSKEVQERVQPLLETVRKGVSDVLSKANIPQEELKKDAAPQEEEEKVAEKPAPVEPEAPVVAKPALVAAETNGHAENGGVTYAAVASEPPAAEAPVVDTPVADVNKL